jgi:hypothetical protein
MEEGKEREYKSTVNCKDYVSSVEDETMER